jgi:hypothetical protein
LRDLFTEYGTAGLIVIGQHIGVDTSTQKLDNLRNQIKILGINYVVIQDLSQDNWYSQNSRYVPTYFLIDRQGHLRYKQVGGGNPALEEAIITLLNEQTGE